MKPSGKAARRLAVIALALVATLSALVSTTALSDADTNPLGADTWTSAHFRDHPLVGTVWRGDGTASDLDTVLNAARSANYVLVGETHPNPDHHRLQAAVIETLSEAGRSPAVVLEMVPASYQDQLDAFSRGIPPDAARLGEALDWDTRGWPDWTIYQPIAEAARASGLMLKAGDLDRDLIRDIGGSGTAALEPDRVRALDLEQALPEDLTARMLAELKSAHCDLLPEQALAPMVTVQRARDGSLAATMIEADAESGEGDGAVLIAGAGHARKDRAVPYVLGRLAPEASVLSVALVEVDAEMGDFADYGDDAPSLPYDFVIFTPKSEIKDHCAELGERFANPTKSD